MVALNTPKADFEFTAKDFWLKSTDGPFYNLQNCTGENGLLLMFICNHCPYVKSIITKLVEDVAALMPYGIKAVAVMPNDVVHYPEDSYENMVIFAKKNNFFFPYLIDETQEVAKTYGAVCTPDFFGFNSALRLCYRGRFDASGNAKINNLQENRDLFRAMKFVAETGKPFPDQKPSIGCSIKWQSGNVRGE